MRFGVVTDVHAAPAGAEGGEFVPFHGADPVSDGWERLASAIGLCLREGAESLLLLGDLAQLGDEETLGRVIRTSSGSGLPVFAVPGNHDASERAEALEGAVRRVGAGNLEIATPAGRSLGGGLRIAGVSVLSEDWGFTSRATAGPRVGAWGEEVVILLSHFPALSSRFRVEGAGLKYAGDLEDVGRVAGHLLRRTAPIVVLSGHLHVRDAISEGPVLQLSLAALVEPPFEVAVVDVEVAGGRVSVRRESLPVVLSPNGARLPVLSPRWGGWAFGAGAWNPAGTAGLRRKSGFAGSRALGRPP